MSRPGPTTRYRDVLRAILGEQLVGETQGLVRARVEDDAQPWRLLSKRDLLGDPPGVVLYGAHRLAVRKAALRAFVKKARIPRPDAPEPFPGLPDVVMVDLPPQLDAFDILMNHYDGRLPEPESGKCKDPFHRAERLTTDDVSVLHFFWLASHILFWPFGAPSGRTTGPVAAGTGVAAGQARIIVVLDTGIEKSHPYFGGMADYLRTKAQDDDVLGQLDSGHGTAVAGVIRRWNDAATIKGGRVQVVGTNLAEEAALAALIDLSDDPKQEVVLNLSLGGKTVGQNPKLRTAIQKFCTSGRHAVVAAAGNVDRLADRGPINPAAWPEVYAVASGYRVGRSVHVDRWSNDGPWVSKYADGYDVLTTWNDPAYQYVRWTGTSFAAPQVAATLV